MTLEVVTSFISNFGFPVAVCAYLLWDRTRLMKEFKEVLHANTAAINSLQTYIGALHGGDKNV